MDHVTKSRRSTMMGAVQGKNTAPEMIVRSAAHSMGLRFRLHGELPGRPDLVLPKWKTVIFVNGCFWHQHEGCKRAALPKSRVDFWQTKMERNVQRDNANYSRLAEMGWRVVVLWECELGRPPQIRRAATLLRIRFKRRVRKV
jgi:DNA mismatch endonuclease (patch repair protein)